MKNVFLFIVLGLFTVGCLDEDSPMSPGDGGTYWGCESTGWVYDELNYCEHMCEEDCYCDSGAECND